MRFARTIESWRETWPLFGSVSGPFKTPRLYEFIGVDNYYTSSSLYVNLGFWAHAETLDEASQDLARVLAETASLGGPELDVLDCGFGFADQDLYWLRRYSPARITGINVTPLQVELARARVQEAGLASRIRLHFGSATAMPFADSTFDRVLALESAFHFETRSGFFTEAMRVLRPGGILATTDLIRGDTVHRDLKSRLIHRLHRALWRTPEVNMYPRRAYAHELGRAGFTNVEVKSIATDVFAPYLAYGERFERAAKGRKRPSPLLKVGSGVMRKVGWFDQYDYVVARAEKQ
jgi:erythromycin 3''-O-methyltransferase